MFRMCASYSHSYTHLRLALGIVREPTVWGLLLQTILAYMTLACLCQPGRLLQVLAGVEEVEASTVEDHLRVVKDTACQPQTGVV